MVFLNVFFLFLSILVISDAVSSDSEDETEKGQVHLSFLYVGHTHEDIDAGFSKIADSLRRNDAETIPELLDLLPNPSNLIWQYDIRSWLEPFIADVRKHTKPLHYKFTMDEVSNKIKLCYKSNHAGPWKISTSGMLMFSDKGEVELPKGVPKVATPVFDKISIEKIESGINDWKCLFTDQVEHHQFNWWKSRVNYMKKLRDDNQFMKSEIIQKAVWYLDKLPKIRVTPDCLDVNNPPKEIEDMINQELIEHEIQITQKRKRKQSEQDKTRPEMKKQKKGKKGNTKNKTARRTIYSAYVYGYICQKKQIFYSIIQELIELIFFFDLICYIHELSYLLWLFYLAVEQHMVSTATVQLCFIQNNVHALICKFQEFKFSTCAVLTLNSL